MQLWLMKSATTTEKPEPKPKEKKKKVKNTNRKPPVHPSKHMQHKHEQFPSNVLPVRSFSATSFEAVTDLSREAPQDDSLPLVAVGQLGLNVEYAQCNGGTVHCALMRLECGDGTVDHIPLKALMCGSIQDRKPNKEEGGRGEEAACRGARRSCCCRERTRNRGSYSLPGASACESAEVRCGRGACHRAVHGAGKQQRRRSSCRRPHAEQGQAQGASGCNRSEGGFSGQEGQMQRSREEGYCGRR